MSDVHVWQVPGRVNLIGEHLDYNGGQVLPIAIDRSMTIKIRSRDDGRIRLWASHDGQQRYTTFFAASRHDDIEPWARYAAAAVWVFIDHGGTASGADVVIESSIPPGAGLSSSAAVTCGLVSALDGLTGPTLDHMTIARLGCRAENEYIGAPVGIMDQLAVTCAQQDSALMIDTRSDPPAIDPIGIHWRNAGLELLVVHVSDRTDADGYRQRRQECEQAARELGLDYLSGAGPDAIVRLDDPVLVARTRHVITETARVRGAAKALSAGEWPELAAMLHASHVSLRDDFEVSCAELDVAVDTAIEAGALGARMTGAGFGGSAIALVPREKLDAVRDSVASAFQQAGWLPPTAFTVRPSPGLRRE